MYNKVYCKNNRIGGLTFMLNHDGGDYYLFDQKFKKNTNMYFSKGVELNKSFRKTLANKYKDIIKTMEKIYAFIKYAKKGNGICVLNNTIAKKKVA